MNAALLLLLFLAVPQDAGTARVEGTVKIYNSPEVAPNVRVSLTRMRAPQENAFGPVLETTSDASGRFSFAGVLPGRYTVYAHSGEFTTPPKRGDFQTVDVGPGQVVRANLVLGWTGSISGRVVRPDGRPLSTGYVYVWHPMYAGQQIILRSHSQGALSETGFYRFANLAPGEYYISVYDQTGGGRTYFPDSPVASNAKPIWVTERGQATADLTFRPEPTFKVSGKIQFSVPDSDKYELAGFYMTRRGAPIRDDVPSLDLAATVTGFPQKPETNVAVVFSSSGSQFEIPAVSPGSYDIFATVAQKSTGLPFGPRYVARTPIEVSGANIENVSVIVRAGVAVTGRVIWSSPELQGPVNFNLRGNNEPGAVMQTVAGSAQFSVSSGVGTLRFDNVPPGAYGLGITGLPAGVYVADVRQDGKSIGPTGLFVGTEPDTSIEVLINDRAGTVRGTLPPLDLPGGAIVILAPETSLRWNNALYKAARSSPTGEFSIGSIAPGNYKIFAFEFSPSGTAASPAFISQYESRGVEITIQPGATIDVQPPVIPRP